MSSPCIRSRNGTFLLSSTVGSTWTFASFTTGLKKTSKAPHPTAIDPNICRPLLPFLVQTMSGGFSGCRGFPHVGSRMRDLELCSDKMRLFWFGEPGICSQT